MLYQFTDFVSFSLLSFCYFLFVDVSNVAVGLDVSPLETWELQEAVLTGNTRYPYTTWNGDSNYPDCIFIFGGQVCTDCSTLFCYNITNGELQEHGSLDSDLYSTRRAYSTQSSFIISDGDDDILYYILYDGDVYYKDLNNMGATDVLKTTVDVTYPCLLKHPDDTEFYIVDGNNGGEFYVYDLEQQSINQGNSMTTSRVMPGCIVNNWDEDNPYIYVLGGKSGWIERINLNNALYNEWETLQLILSNGLSDMCGVTIGSLYASSIASYNNFIYLIGGYDGSREDDIFAVDVENWEVFWAGLFPSGISCAAATAAEDRIYMIGGYTSGDTDDIYISNSFDDVSDDDIIEDDDAISPLETWQLKEAVLTGNTRYPYSAYNPGSSFPDCIFIFGGNVCTDCDTLFCYNITNDTLQVFGSMDSDLSGTRAGMSNQAAFIMSDDNADLLYYILYDGDVYYYDLNDPDSSEVLKGSFDVTYPCLVAHPDNSEFYVIDGYNGGEFYIYDLQHCSIYQGDTMTDPRFVPGCIVNDWDEDNPFIYVMGGQSGWIERMSIRDGEARNNEWETLQLILSNGLSDMCGVTVGSLYASSIVSYNNFIYLIAGYDGSREDDIFALDVENWEVFWAGLFPTGISCAAASYAQDRVYMIGGYTSGDTDDFYISNSFSEVVSLAASKSSSSCDDDSSNSMTKQQQQVAIPPKYHKKKENKENKEIVLDIEKEDMVLNSDNKNVIDNDSNTNNMVVKVLSISLNVFLILYIFTSSKCARINNKKGDYHYQSI